MSGADDEAQVLEYREMMRRRYQQQASAPSPVTAHDGTEASPAATPEAAPSLASAPAPAPQASQWQPREDVYQVDGTGDEDDAELRAALLLSTQDAMHGEDPLHAALLLSMQDTGTQDASTAMRHTEQDNQDHVPAGGENEVGSFESQFPTGSSVMIHGLESANGARFNGTLGAVTGHTDERVLVRFPDGSIKKVKAPNLVLRAADEHEVAFGRAMGEGSLSIARCDYDKGIEQYHAGVKAASAMTTSGAHVALALVSLSEAMLEARSPPEKVLQAADDALARPGEEMGALRLRALLVRAAALGLCGRTKDAIECYESVESTAPTGGSQLNSYTRAAQHRLSVLHAQQGDMARAEHCASGARVGAGNPMDSLFSLMSNMEGGDMQQWEQKKHAVKQMNRGGEYRFLQICRDEVAGMKQIITERGPEHVTVFGVSSLCDILSWLENVGGDYSTHAMNMFSELFELLMSRMREPLKLLQPRTAAQEKSLIAIVQRVNAVHDQLQNVSIKRSNWMQSLEVGAAYLACFRRLFVGVGSGDLVSIALSTANSRQAVAAALVRLGNYTGALRTVEVGVADLGEYEAVHEGPMGMMGSGLRKVALQKIRGDALRRLGRPDESLAVYRGLLDAIELGTVSAPFGAEDDSQGMRLDLSNDIGAVLHDMGNYEQALASSKRALELCDRVRNGDSKRARIRGNMGNMLKGMGRFKEAMDSYEQALQILRSARTRNMESEGRVLMNMANLSFQRPGMLDDAEAAKMYREAGALARSNNDLYMLARASSALGFLEKSRGRFAAAETLFHESMSAFERIQDGVKDDDELLLSVFEHMQIGPYIGMMVLLRETGRAEEAVLMGDSSKSRALSKLLCGRRRGRLEWPHVQALARAEECMVLVYTRAEQENTVWIQAITKDGVLHHHQTTIDRHECGETLQSARDAMGARGRRARGETPGADAPEPNDADNGGGGAELAKLYQLLIAPMQEHLDAHDRLVLVPVEDLFAVPWAALTDPDGNYLVQRVSIRVVPSLLVWHTLASVRSDLLLDKALFVGNPWPVSVEVQPLKRAQEEAEILCTRISRRVREVRLLTLGEANLREVSEACAGAGWAHFACHGLLDEMALVLAKGEGGCDGLLGKDQVAGLGLLKGCVAVLSACDTARGQVRHEGVVGLSRAFLAAGAASVLVTLWSVDDDATKEMMALVYQRLMEGIDLEKALQYAMLEAMGRTLVQPGCGPEGSEAAGVAAEEDLLEWGGGGRSWGNEQGKAEKAALEQLFNASNPFKLNDKPVGKHNGLDDKYMVENHACKKLFCVRAGVHPEKYMDLWGRNGFIASNKQVLETSRVQAAVGKCTRCHREPGAKKAAVENNDGFQTVGERAPKNVKCQHVDCTLRNKNPPSSGLLRSLHFRNAQLKPDGSVRHRTHLAMYSMLKETVEELTKTISSAATGAHPSGRSRGCSGGDELGSRSLASPVYWAGLVVTGLSAVMMPRAAASTAAAAAAPIAAPAAATADAAPTLVAAAVAAEKGGQQELVRTRVDAMQWQETVGWLEEQDAPRKVIEAVREQRLKGRTLAKLTAEEMQKQFGIEPLQAMQLFDDLREDLL